MVWRQVQHAPKWLRALKSRKASLCRGHCCTQEHAGAGVVQMAGALFKMKAQAVLLHSVCTD